jgi:hypothetical protein
METIAEKALIIPKAKMVTITDVAGAVAMLNKATYVLSAAKLFCEEVEVAVLAYMKENNICEISLSDTVKVYRGKNNKDRFDTQAIYAALGFTNEQQAVLPKNPAWKKTEVLKNNKVCHAHWIEEGEKLELKRIDTKFISSEVA